MTRSLYIKIGDWIDSPTTSHAQEGFYKFRLLPPDIQLRIWKFALPAARIVAIRHEMDSWHYIKFEREQDWDPHAAVSHECYRQWLQDFSKSTVHTYGFPLLYIFRVCKDSYQEALEHFKLRIDTNGIERPLRVNSDEDTLYFPWTGLNLGKIEFETGGLWNDEALDSMKHLAFDVKRLGNLLKRYPGNPFRRFTALEDVTIIDHGSHCNLRNARLNGLTLHFDVPDITPSSSPAINQTPKRIPGVGTQILRLQDIQPGMACSTSHPQSIAAGRHELQ